MDSFFDFLKERFGATPPQQEMDWSSDVGAGLMRRMPAPEPQYTPGHDRWGFYREEMQKANEATDPLTAIQHGAGGVLGAIGTPFSIANEMVSRNVLGEMVYRAAKTKGTPVESFQNYDFNGLRKLLGIDYDTIMTNADDIVAAYESSPYGKSQTAWEMYSRGRAPLQTGFAELATDPTSLIGSGLARGVGQGFARGSAKALTRNEEMAQLGAEISKMRGSLDPIAAARAEWRWANDIPEMAREYSRNERIGKLSQVGQAITVPGQVLDKLSDRLAPYIFGGMVGAMGIGAVLSRVDPEMLADKDIGLLLTGGTGAGMAGWKGLGKLPLARLSGDALASIEANKLRDAIRKVFGGLKTEESDGVTDFGELSGLGTNGTPATNMTDVAPSAAAPVDTGKLARMTAQEAGTVPGTQASLVNIKGEPMLQVYDKGAYGRGEKPTLVRLDPNTKALAKQIDALPRAQQATAKQELAGQIIDKMGKRGEWTEYQSLHHEAINKADYKDLIAKGEMTAQKAVEVYKSAGMRAPEDLYKMAQEEKKLGVIAEREQKKAAALAEVDQKKAAYKAEVDDAAQTLKDQIADGNLSWTHAIAVMRENNYPVPKEFFEGERVAKQAAAEAEKAARTKAAAEAKQLQLEAQAKAAASKEEYPRGLGRPRAYNLGPGQPAVYASMHPEDEMAFLATVSTNDNAKAAYAQRFMEATGATPQQLVEHGKAIRQAIRNAAPHAEGGKVVIPKIELGTIATEPLREKMAQRVVAKGAQSMTDHAMNAIKADTAEQLRSLVQDKKLDPEIARHWQTLENEATDVMKSYVRNSLDRATAVVGQAPPEIQRDIARDYWQAVNEHLKANRVYLREKAEAQRVGASTGPAYERYNAKTRQIWDARSAKETAHYEKWRSGAAPQEPQEREVPAQEAAPTSSTGELARTTPEPVHSEPAPEVVREADRKYFEQFNSRGEVADAVWRAATSGEHGDWSELWALYRQAHAADKKSTAFKIKPGESLEDTVRRYSENADKAEWFSIRNGIRNATGGRYSPATPKDLIEVFKDKGALRQYINSLAHRAEESNSAPWIKAKPEARAQEGHADERPNEADAERERLLAEKAAANKAAAKAVADQIIEEYKSGEKYTPFENLTERQKKALEDAELTNAARYGSQERVEIDSAMDSFIEKGYTDEQLAERLHYIKGITGKDADAIIRAARERNVRTPEGDTGPEEQLQRTEPEQAKHQSEEDQAPAAEVEPEGLGAAGKRAWSEFEDHTGFEEAYRAGKAGEPIGERVGLAKRAWQAGEADAPIKLKSDAEVDAILGKKGFDEGDRVQTPDGKHGTIAKVERSYWQDMYGRKSEGAPSYTVKWDDGTEGYGYNIKTETDTAPKANPAPELDGRKISVDDLKREIQSYKQQARNAYRAADRAHKRENINALVAEGKRKDAEAARRQAILDDYYRQHPEDKGFEAPEPARPKQPEGPRSGGAAADARITERSAQGGIEIRFNSKPSDEVITKLRNRGFRWSGRQKLWYKQPSSDAGRKADVDAMREFLHGKPSNDATPQPKPAAADVRPTEEPAERPTTAGTEAATTTTKEAGDGRTGDSGQGVKPLEGEQSRASEGARPSGRAEDSPKDDTVREPADSAGVRPGRSGERSDEGSSPRDHSVSTENPTAKGLDHVIDLDSDPVGAKAGARTIYNENLTAIRLLKTLRAEGRRATSEEQAILSKYRGWGASKLNRMFERGSYEYDELKSLLGEDEFRALQKSRLNAHYTDPKVIGAVWKALDRMGLGSLSRIRLLEPSAGSGWWFGLQPANLAARSARTGVELDKITGGILEQLYQNADVHVTGYQDARVRPNDYDLIVSNVPFAQTGFNRTAWMEKGKDWLNKQGLHNQFFVLAAEHVRPGGVIAFITSRYTLDGGPAKAVREHLAKEMDFLGAVRLPRNAFRDVADTEVVTDIIFLRKRLPGEEPKHAGDWIETRKLVLDREYDYKTRKEVDITADVNEYFLANPRMVLGAHSHGGSMYRANEYTVDFHGDDLEAKLAEALGNLPEGVIKPYVRTVTQDASRLHIPRDPSKLKDGSFYIEDGKAYQFIGGKGLEASADTARVTSYLKLRDAAKEVLRLQIEGADDATLLRAQVKARAAHDAFYQAYGPLNSTYNKSKFRKDPDSPFMRALENWDKKAQGAFKDKSLKAADFQMPLFRERVVREVKPVVSANDAADALAVTLNERGRIDFEHMAKLTGKSVDDLERELTGRVFHNPDGDWETAEEYLSGFVKDKLKAAEGWAKRDKRYEANVEALKKVQPADLLPSVIDVRLGSHWVPAKVFARFADEIFQMREGSAQLRYNAPISEYSFETRLDWWPVSNALNYNTYGTDRFSAANIFDAVINNKSIKVYDSIGDGKTELNAKETAKAREKAELLAEEFGKWLWKDEKRSAELARMYNDRYNNYIPRNFDGAHLTFPGMATDWASKLRPHQRGAVWRILQGGNTLLAHVVGAGKTAEMAAAAMELRRMGLSKKNLFVVPNHLVEQWSADFTRIYPDAQILVPTKADFQAGNRAELMSRIATGDYDAVIIAQSQMTLLPNRPEKVMEHITKQIQELENYLLELRGSKGDSRQSQKDVERAKAALEKQLDKEKKKLEKRTDNTLYFDELGVDSLFVDEADMYKNLFFMTKMERVKGLSNTNSQRSFDMFLKVRHVSDRNGGRGVVFGTGTPVSNTIAELWTMMRYLMPERLDALGIGRFDAWASQFAQAETTMAQTVSGAIKPVTRFSKFVNAPELSKIFQSVADIQTAEDLNLPRPRLVGGKVQQVTVPPPPSLLKYMEKIIARIDNLKNVDPTIDNMLKISSDARKAALDMRLVDAKAPDDPNGKIPTAARNIAKIYNEYTNTGNPDTDRAAQLVFLDLGTPKVADEGFKAKTREILTAEESMARLKEYEAADEFGEDFVDEDAAAREVLTGEEAKLVSDVYSLLKKRLVNEYGIPAEEIAFIHEYNTPTAKTKLFQAVRDGDIRVLIGSTGKMGPGMNVQDRLVALHHLDAPWRPRDIEQREGRILRQGNFFDAVHVFNYVTEKSFDGYVWEALYAKAHAIKRIMRREVVDRSVVDNDDMVLSAAEARALASGNPAIRKKAELEVKVNKLKARYSSWVDEQHQARAKVTELPAEMERTKGYIKEYRDDIELRNRTEGQKFEVTLGGKVVTDKEAFVAALEAIEPPKAEWVADHQLGEYRGFELSARVWRGGAVELKLKSPNGTVYSTTQIEKGGLGSGAITRLNNALESMEDRVYVSERKIAGYEQDLTLYKGQVGKPFENEAELRELEGELASVMHELGLDKTDNTQALGIVHPSYQKWAEMAEGIKRLMDPETKPVRADEELRAGVHEMFPTIADEHIDTIVRNWDVISKVHKQVTTDKAALADEIERLRGKGIPMGDSLSMNEAFAKLKSLSQDRSNGVDWQRWKRVRDKYTGSGDLLLDDPVSLMSEMVDGPVREKMGVGKGWKLPHEWATRPVIGALIGAMLNPDDPMEGAAYLGIAGATTHPKFMAAFKNLALATGRYPMANALDALGIRSGLHGVKWNPKDLTDTYRGKPSKLDAVEKKIGKAPAEVSKMRLVGVNEGEGVSKTDVVKGVLHDVPLPAKMAGGAAIGAIAPADDENKGKAMVAGAAVGAGLTKWTAVTKRVAAVTENVARRAAWAKEKSAYLEKEYPRFRSRLLRALPDGSARTKVAAVLDGENGQFEAGWLRETLIDLKVDKGVADKAAKDWANVGAAGDDKGVAFAGHIQFDYHYTKADEFLKNFVPFHFYATRNLPWYAEHIAEHPIIAQAVIQLNNAAEDQREDAGLTSRFLGMFVLKGGIGDLAAEMVSGGRKGSLGLDPLAAMVSVMSQVRDPMEWEGENAVGRGLNLAGQAGLSFYPGIQAAVQSSGVSGSKPGPSFVPQSGYLKDIAGIDPEKKLRELGAKVQSKKIGADVDPEALQKSKIRARIAEMATEAGKPGSYDAFMDDAKSEVYKQARRDVLREAAGTAATSYMLPTRTKFLSETEERVRKTRAEHYPQADIEAGEELDTAAYAKAAEQYPEGTTYTGAYQSPEKRNLSGQLKEMMAQFSPREIEVYNRLATAYANATSETSKMIFRRTVSKEDQATYEKVYKARQSYLASHPELAGYWKRNGEEASKGNSAYGMGDYLAETGKPASSFDLRKTPTDEQAAAGALNPKAGALKYKLQADLKEYMDFKDKNWMLMGTQGGSRWRDSYLGDHPLVASYLAWKGKNPDGNTDQFLRERIAD